MKPGKQLFRPDEVARLFSVSKRTVYRWWRTGELDGVKVRGTLRITRGSIERIFRRKSEVE